MGRTNCERFFNEQLETVIFSLTVRVIGTVELCYPLGREILNTVLVLPEYQIRHDDNGAVYSYGCFYFRRI
jgi:hypothetical protein